MLLQRAASQEVAAAVRDTVARLRDDGVQVPVYVCWWRRAPRTATRPCCRRRPCPAFHGSNAPHEWAASRSAGAPQMPQVPTTGFASEQAGPRADMVATAPPPTRARPPLRLAVPPGLGPLASLAMRELLPGTGMPVIETILCGNAAAAAAAADYLGYPVVLKVAHPSMTHKSEWARPSGPDWPGWCPGGDPAGCPASGRAGGRAEATALLRSQRGAAVLDGVRGSPRWTSGPSRP